MDRERALKVVLMLVGFIFLFAVYPLMMYLWPSGWRWQPNQPEYEQMILGVYATLGIFLLLAWQLHRTKSDVYRWFGKPLEYRANYTLTVVPVSDSQTRIDIRTHDSSVLLATTVGVHAGNLLDYVAPTTVEEYRFLLFIGKSMGEQGMPPLRLP